MTTLAVDTSALLRRYVRAGPPEVKGADAHAPLDDERQLSFAY